MQVRNARDLATWIADYALVDTGVTRSYVEHHQRVVAVARVVGDAVLVAELQRLVVVVPLTRRRHRRIDLAPEVRHCTVVKVLIAHRFKQSRSGYRSRLDVNHRYRIYIVRQVHGLG